MTKHLPGNTGFTTRVPVCFFAFAVIILLTGCSKKQNPIGSNDPLYKDLVVWLKPGKDRAAFDSWRADIVSRYGDVTIKRSCTSCDNSLMLLTGRGIEIYIQGPSASGGREPFVQQGVVGDDGPVYVSLNYPTPKSDTVSNFLPITPLPVGGKYNKTDSIKLAVFDTGVEPGELNGYLYRSSIDACISGGMLGWNFADNNPSTADNHGGRHGTTVARFSTGQVLKAMNNPAQVLPVKTQDASGAGHLYDMLCGFAYAKERKVQIINVSVGFYDAFRDDQKVVLLRKYVEYYLTKNSILLVAAAGNKDDENERKAFEMAGRPLPTDLRSLDNISFYPGSLSKYPELTNVITVTTIDTTRLAVSPGQNYSKNFVDIGVQADRVLTGADGLHFVFINPRMPSDGNTAEGSSFATPIVAGRLSALYSYYQDLVTPAAPLNKRDIFNRLITSSQIRTSSGLADKINSGRIVIK